MLTDPYIIHLPDTVPSPLFFSSTLTAHVRGIVQAINSGDKFKSYGELPPSRFVIHGAPGSGKMCLARFMAYLLKCPLFELQAHLVPVDGANSLISAVLNTKMSDNLARIAVVIDNFDFLCYRDTDAFDIHDEYNISYVKALLNSLPPDVIFIGLSEDFARFPVDVRCMIDGDIGLELPTHEQITAWVATLLKQIHISGSLHNAHQMANMLTGFTWPELIKLKRDVLYGLVSRQTTISTWRLVWDIIRNSSQVNKGN